MFLEPGNVVELHTEANVETGVLESSLGSSSY